MTHHHALSIVAASVALGLTTLLAGCGSGGAGSANGASVTVPDPDVENFSQPAELSIEIGGLHSIRFAGRSTLNVLRADGPEDIRIMTVGTFEGVKSGDWTIHEAFLNLVHFTGDGTYEVTAPAAGSGEPAMADNAYVTVSRATADDPIADAGRFDALVKPCTASIKQGGVEGALRCDGLADDSGNVVTFTMIWRPVGEPTDLLRGAG